MDKRTEEFVSKLFSGAGHQAILESNDVLKEIEVVVTSQSV